MEGCVCLARSLQVLTDPAVPVSKEAALALVSQEPIGYSREAAQARYASHQCPLFVPAFCLDVEASS